MSEIAIGAPALRHLVESLAADVERGAALYLTYDEIGERHLVQEVALAGPDDVISASGVEITFAPQFLTYVTRRARQTGRGLALLHTHPSGFAEFSARDDATEAELAGFMADRLEGNACFSLVLCDGRLIARRFGQLERETVREVGSNVILTGCQTEAGQAEILSNLEVAIVGLGGTGSVAAQQLTHLGVRRFVLVDADVVEDTNLNRVVGASDTSIGQTKIDVAADMIHRIFPNAEVRSYAGSVMTAHARDLLRTVDCIFVCTDSHTSRAFLNEFVYQYLIPAFDVGVAINARDGVVDAITGRTQMLSPGLPCLWCSQALDSRRIREELMTEEERARDPYFNEGGAKQPAVISLNSTMVSLAVTMFLGAFTAVPAGARWQRYDGVSGVVRLMATKPDAECSVCGPAGVTGAGATRSLPFINEEAA
jgi:molybdopterin/thiamine biosynthesis adenylyltransferase